MMPTAQRDSSLRYYHRKAAQFVAEGLTSRGLPRRRRAALTAEERRQYNNAKFRMRSERLFDQGLTTRGTKRKIRIGRATVLGEFRRRVANAVFTADQSKAASVARVAEMLRTLEKV